MKSEVPVECVFLYLRYKHVGTTREIPASYHNRY